MEAKSLLTTVVLRSAERIGWGVEGEPEKGREPTRRAGFGIAGKGSVPGAIGAPAGTFAPLSSRSLPRSPSGARCGACSGAAPAAAQRNSVAEAAEPWPRPTPI